MNNEWKKLMMSKKKVPLLLIIMAGFLLRFVNVANNPPSLYWDEASIGYEAYSVTQTGKDMHGNYWFQAIFPAYGDYKAPVYIWLTAVVMKLIGPTNLAVRLASVILGTLTIGLVYQLVQELSDRRNKEIWGWLVALLVAFSPWHLQFSRAGFEAVAGLFWITLALLLLLKSRRKGFWAIGAALAGGLGVYSYFSVRAVFPLLVIGVIVVFFQELKQQWRWILLGSIIFGLSLIPLFTSPYYQASNQFRFSTDNIFQNEKEIIYSNLLREQDSNSIMARVIHHRMLYTAKELVKNINDHLGLDYLFITGDPNPRHSTGVTGVILTSLMPLFLIGIYSGWVKKRKLMALLFIWWLVGLLPAAVPQETPHALRSLNSLPALYIILGIGGVEVWKWCRKNLVRRLIGLGYVVMVVINFGGYWHFYQKHYPLLTNQDWQDGYRQVAEYLASQEKKYDYLTVTDQDRLYLYVLFYSKYPPEKIQKLREEGEILEGFYLNHFEKYTFRQIVWQEEQRGPTSSLIVARPGDIPPEVPIKDYIYDINGQVEYVAVDLATIGRK